MTQRKVLSTRTMMIFNKVNITPYNSAFISYVHTYTRNNNINAWLYEWIVAIYMLCILLPCIFTFSCTYIHTCTHLYFNMWIQMKISKMHTYFRVWSTNNTLMSVAEQFRKQVELLLKQNTDDMNKVIPYSYFRMKLFRISEFSERIFLISFFKKILRVKHFHSTLSRSFL